MNTLSVTDHNDKSHPPHFHINTTKGIYNIPLNNILFIESHQKKSLVHLKKETIILHIPLYRLKETLPSELFLQTHRSYLVNLKNISYIDKQKDPWIIDFFDSNEHAFISRSFRHQVLAAISD